MKKAAHCVFQVSSADLGHYDLRNDDGVVHQKLNWSNKRVHPNYNYHTADNDIGLIKLTEPYYAPHYAVPYNSQSMPSDLTVIGWGRTSFNGAQPNILRKAEVNGVSDSYCTQRYSSYNSSSMICASAPGRDSCQGDSGELYLRLFTGNFVAVSHQSNHTKEVHFSNEIHRS